MSNYHRLFKLGRAPGKRPQQVVLYADLDGALRTVDEDGTDAAVGGGGGGSQPITSPLQIDNCEGWWDASQLSLADDAAVASLPDLAGNGYDAVQDDAELQPVCKTAVANGLRIVRFDNSGPPTQALQLASVAGLFNGWAGVTMAVVARPASSSAIALFGVLSAENLNIRFEVTSEDNGINNLYVQPDDAHPQANLLAGIGAGDVFRSAVYAWDGGYAVTAALSYSQQETSFADSPFTSLDPDSAYIGGDAFAVGLLGGLTADVAEIVLYSRALNVTERQRLYEYLSVKWGTL